MLVLVLSDLSLEEWAFKPENVCAYRDTVLLPKWGLFSQEAFRWEQLELNCHGRAHLDWALGVGWLVTNFPHVRISAKWALKLPSKSSFGNILPLKTALCHLLPSLHASGFMHFPLTLSSMLSLHFSWLRKLFCMENAAFSSSLEKICLKIIWCLLTQ